MRSIKGRSVMSRVIVCVCLLGFGVLPGRSFAGNFEWWSANYGYAAGNVSRTYRSGSVRLNQTGGGDIFSQFDPQNSLYGTTYAFCRLSQIGGTNGGNDLSIMTEAQANNGRTAKSNFYTTEGTPNSGIKYIFAKVVPSYRGEYKPYQPIRVSVNVFANGIITNLRQPNPSNFNFYQVNFCGAQILAGTDRISRRVSASSSVDTRVGDWISVAVSAQSNVAKDGRSKLELQLKLTARPR